MSRHRHFAFLMLIAGFFAALSGLSSSTVRARHPPGLSGKLETVKGIRVLRLWGGAFDRGHAHGYLLADDILDLFENAIVDPRILADPQDYEQRVRPTVAEKMRFDPQRTAELDGMLQGIRAARAEKGIKLKQLNRNLTRTDLEAVNTFAAWYRPACSSFSAWDARTDGRATITARNLDFITVPWLRTRHLITVYLEPGPGRKKWVSIGWPGLIGAYTAMNEDGVTISMHDAPGLPPTHQGKFDPRSYVLRDAIERASGVSAIEDIRRVLLASPVLPGNNIHVSGPFMGQANPAAVLEYDGNTTKDGGVTMRVGLDEQNPRLANLLLCTNHYRKRAHAPPCDRFETLRKYFESPTAATQKIDVKVARRIMQSVAGDGTVHTVVFLPNSKELYVSFADPARNAALAEPVRFRLSELFRK